jgi:hypothetical protein
MYKIGYVKVLINQNGYYAKRLYQCGKKLIGVANLDKAF